MMDFLFSDPLPLHCPGSASRSIPSCLTPSLFQAPFAAFSCFKLQCGHGDLEPTVSCACLLYLLSPESGNIVVTAMLFREAGKTWPGVAEACKRPSISDGRYKIEVEGEMYLFPRVLGRLNSILIRIYVLTEARVLFVEMAV